MKRNYFYIKHYHKHGTDFYVIKTKREHEDLPDLQYLCELLGIDYNFSYDDITEFIDMDRLYVTNLDEKI